MTMMKYRKCGGILALLFSLNADIRTIEPSQDATPTMKVPGHLMDPVGKIHEIIKAHKGMNQMNNVLLEYKFLRDAQRSQFKTLSSSCGN
jgi:flagellar biosynthesis/type III secretory pathway chaperone